MQDTCYQFVCSCVRLQLSLFLLFEDQNHDNAGCSILNMIQDMTPRVALAWQGVLSALQGVKAENSFVIAIFLKILLLSSSGSIVAAKLIQSGTFFQNFHSSSDSLHMHANDMWQLEDHVTFKVSHCPCLTT